MCFVFNLIIHLTNTTLKIIYFLVLLFFLFSCALPRYKKQPDAVRMVHYHYGEEYRGVSLWDWFFKYKNPRQGQGYGSLAKDPAAVHKKNKGRYITRVKDNRTYARIPTEEEWIKLTNPPKPKSGLVDTSTTNKKEKEPTKKEKKASLTPDETEEEPADTTNK